MNHLNHSCKQLGNEHLGLSSTSLLSYPFAGSFLWSSLASYSSSFSLSFSSSCPFYFFIAFCCCCYCCFSKSCYDNLAIFSARCFGVVSGCLSVQQTIFITNTTDCHRTLDNPYWNWLTSWCCYVVLFKIKDYNKTAPEIRQLLGSNYIGVLHCCMYISTMVVAAGHVIIL